ncbi:MAG: hypothetical protein LBI95_00875 [Holosporales bacterium]|jgi:hypothetical protein|nr:hypothetical protein [Holosporales bacterium]
MFHVEHLCLQPADGSSFNINGLFRLGHAGVMVMFEAGWVLQPLIREDEKIAIYPISKCYSLRVRG